MNANQTPDIDAGHTRPWLPWLTAAFGTAVAMWFVGFVTHLPGLGTPPALTGVLLLLTQFAGFALLGRSLGGRNAWLSGLAGGAATGLINLLIVGAIVADQNEGGTGLRSGWVVITGGTMLAGAVIGALGALAGSRFGRPGAGASDQRWLGRYGVVTAAAAIPVLLSGGIVTSAEAGMAVPDWPASFGANMFLFPLSKMTGGIYYEHAHRLFGSLVGLTVLSLAITVLFAERRAWVKGFAWGVGLLVLAQGLIGGFRVTKDSQVLAFTHGISGQVTFTALAILACVLSPYWIATRDRPRTPARAMRMLVGVMAGLFVLQLVLGAGVRHFDQHPAFLHTHILFAVVLALVTPFVGFRSRKLQPGGGPMRFFGTLLVHGIGWQFMLGLLALWVVLTHQNAETPPPIELVVATAHQAMGALLIGATGALAVWTFRLTSAAPAPADAGAPEAAASPAG